MMIGSRTGSDPGGDFICTFHVGRKSTYSHVLLAVKIWPVSSSATLPFLSAWSLLKTLMARLNTPHLREYPMTLDDVQGLPVQILKLRLAGHRER